MARPRHLRYPTWIALAAVWGRLAGDTSGCLDLPLIGPGLLGPDEAERLHSSRDRRGRMLQDGQSRRAPQPPRTDRNRPSVKSRFHRRRSNPAASWVRASADPMPRPRRPPRIVAGQEDRSGPIGDIPVAWSAPHLAPVSTDMPCRHSASPAGCPLYLSLSRLLIRPPPGRDRSISASKRRSRLSSVLRTQGVIRPPTILIDHGFPGSVPASSSTGF